MENNINKRYKSFTSLEQSKKLAKILPIESADMFLALNGTIPVMSKYIDGGLVTADNTAIPCWSLAALLNILHFRQDDIPSLSGGGYKDGNYTPDWCLDYEYDNGDYQKTFADNPVDACVAMIERLHKLKML